MSWTLLLWLGLAGNADCAEVLDRTDACSSPAASRLLVSASESQKTPPAPSAGDTLAQKLVAASGVAAFVSLGAGVTAGFFHQHRTQLAATHSFSLENQEKIEGYTAASTQLSIFAGLAASLLLAAGGVFTLFDPATGGLREGIPVLQE